ncbi:MAG: tetratricopeptide repeat protein, partial [Planctomycetota bacterium]
MIRAVLLVACCAVPALAQTHPPAALERLPSELPRAATDAWTESLAGGEVDLAPAASDALARAQRAYRSGDYPSAVEFAFAALEAEPDLPPALTLLGTTYFRLQRYGDTATCFERFCEVAPGELWRTQALGHAYYSLGRYERAHAHYQRVIATGRAGIDALRGRGLAELRLGREEEGLANAAAIEFTGAV